MSLPSKQATIASTVERMNLHEVMDELIYLVNHPDYEESGYTTAVRDLIARYRSKGDITKGQLKFLKNHLLMHSELWY